MSDSATKAAARQRWYAARARAKADRIAAAGFPDIADAYRESSRRCGARATRIEDGTEPVGYMDPPAVREQRMLAREARVTADRLAAHGREDQAAPWREEADRHDGLADRLEAALRRP